MDLEEIPVDEILARNFVFVCIDKDDVICPSRWYLSWSRGTMTIAGSNYPEKYARMTAALFGVLYNGVYEYRLGPYEYLIMACRIVELNRSDIPEEGIS